MDSNSPVIQITNDPFAAVRIPEFRNLMLGRFTFITALRMMSTLVAWWVYELTGDPFAIGLVGLSEVIPALSMALYAGHVIDKSEKRKSKKSHDGESALLQNRKGDPDHDAFRAE